MSELNFQDQAKGGNAQSGLVGTNDKQILMLLSEDLRKTYMRPLVDRLHELDVIAAIDELNYPEEKQKKFHWILRFPGDIPDGKTPDINSAKFLGDILNCLEKIIAMFVDSSPKFFFDGTSTVKESSIFSIKLPFFSDIFFNISDKEILK